MSSSKLRAGLGLTIVATILTACGGSDSETDVVPRGVNGTYLTLTYESQVLGENSEQVLYYGTQNVGTSEAFAVRIANRGADVYPLKNISVVGPNAEEFATEVLDEITLQPSEVVNMDIAFQPITEGPKDAIFQLDYDTIQMVDESVNINEQSFYQANDLEAAGQFRAARQTYSEYLDNDPVTVNKRRAAIRLPIIDEAESYDGEEELGLYLQAMTQRDEQQFDLAIRTLDTFTALYPESYLTDDAIYLKGYIQLMDLHDPTNALRSMQVLRESFPDTTYYDTSLYSEAIAQIEIGNELVARQILLELKDRHTGIDTLGIQLPKDNLMSHLWFDRAKQILENELKYSTTN